MLSKHKHIKKRKKDSCLVLFPLGKKKTKKSIQLSCLLFSTVSNIFSSSGSSANSCTLRLSFFHSITSRYKSSSAASNGFTPDLISRYFSLFLSPSAYLTCSGSLGSSRIFPKCFMLHCTQSNQPLYVEHRHLRPTGDAHKRLLLLFMGCCAFVMYSAESLKHVCSV